VAFRAQLVIFEQLQLYDHWVATARGRPMPDRSDIEPSAFPKLLPCISLLERTEHGRLRVRLAGTRLRELFDREITGLYVDDCDFGAKPGYWRAVYDHLTTTCLPAQGVVRGPRMHKEHLVHFWLRLPLRHDGIPAAMILGHDIFVPAQDVPDTIGSDQPVMSTGYAAGSR
jgi:hypothetical protein